MRERYQRGASGFPLVSAGGVSETPDISCHVSTSPDIVPGVDQLEGSGLHEGFLECVFPDGRAGADWDGRGVVVTVDADGSPLPVELRQSRPPSQVVAWRVACDCLDGERGWTSELWLRVPSPALEDLRTHRIHSADEQTCAIDDRDDVSAAAETQWYAEHVRPRTALEEINRARENVAFATARLHAAVLAAREAGASWATIGRAAGVTRQSAHARWGRAGEADRASR
jgi:hypothetical protein